jgi:hypothetical protein
MPKFSRYCEPLSPEEIEQLRDLSRRKEELALAALYDFNLRRVVLPEEFQEFNKC